jgi:hypothetical protein
MDVSFRKVFSGIGRAEVPAGMSVVAERPREAALFVEVFFFAGIKPPR